MAALGGIAARGDTPALIGCTRTTMKKLRRVSLLVREDQYQKVQSLGLNLSGLIRDLLDDRLSDKRIVLSVAAKTRSVYDHLVSNCGATDEELQQCFLKALDTLLEQKIHALEKVRSKIKDRDHGK